MVRGSQGGNRRAPGGELGLQAHLSGLAQGILHALNKHRHRDRSQLFDRLDIADTASPMARVFPVRSERATSDIVTIMLSERRFLGRS